MEGAIMKESLDHFLKFTFFDIMDFNGQECEITITPTLLSLTGSIQATDNKNVLNW